MEKLRKLIQRFPYIKDTFRRKPIKNCIYPKGTLKILNVSIASVLISYGKISVEDDLRKALEQGEPAIVDLMNQLQNLVINVSKEYRLCLENQIILIKSSGDAAAEDLPKFRTQATELNQELTTYIILLKTIGGILSYEESFINHLADAELERILKTYKKLEILLLKEFQLNKEKELDLMEVVLKHISSGYE
ncbi:hypothetical protein ABEB36_011758 [Hypothenemus hampei]|uniref:Uncharacterized protein n=1 Tax=Hypothenemus hampei TaxID=57062 RepID=A0ABD1E926_HYPHA